MVVKCIGSILLRPCQGACLRILRHYCLRPAQRKVQALIKFRRLSTVCHFLCIPDWVFFEFGLVLLVIITAHKLLLLAPTAIIADLVPIRRRRLL